MDVERIKELIKRIGKNDEKALEELFQQTKKQLYLVAKEYLNEKSYAEDVLSEGYLKIYKKSKLYNERYNGYNWMYEIVKNIAIDYNRKYKKESKIEEYDDTAYIAKEEIGNRISKEEIRQAMKVLDEREYKIIYLRIWEKRTLQMIAEVTKYNITGVYRTYKAALEKLRKVLE
ncbi:MAG: sigma-70 family RNA polymerase sigma factor [Anaeroplasmataceae bacterium]|nr:sigma-70 family RNA polymerase sigma factor [Anaeroplasmataceae bacterium]MDE6414321.1 sigma-70 family RNA polymerase sigma factor [Anaeroplasmataceae bacterium]